MKCPATRSYINDKHSELISRCCFPFSKSSDPRVLKDTKVCWQYAPPPADWKLNAEKTDSKIFGSALDNQKHVGWWKSIVACTNIKLVVWHPNNFFLFLGNILTMLKSIGFVDQQNSTSILIISYITTDTSLIKLNISCS